MGELFHNRSAAFISLDPYGTLGVTVIFSSGRIDGAWIIINGFLRGAKQQSALVKISRCNFFQSQLMDRSRKRCVSFLGWKAGANETGLLSRCLQGTERQTRDPLTAAGRQAQKVKLRLAAEPLFGEERTQWSPSTPASLFCMALCLHCTYICRVDRQGQTRLPSRDYL